MKIITLLLCITILECFAMYQGYNGDLMKWVIASMVGIVGVAMPRPKFMRIGKW